jgi:hypothetical protein
MLIGNPNLRWQMYHVNMREIQRHPLALDDPRFRLVDGRTRPEFMLIGGAKCGSTSFARHLSAHPQLKLWGPKEPNYWSWRNFHSRYQNFFVNESPVLNPDPDQYISGEFSTSLLVHPLAPRRVQPNLPTLRIFVLLRNPADRAYSHFMMAKNAGLEKECSFDEVVRVEMGECPELLAAHERSFLNTTDNSQVRLSAMDGAPIRIAKHERGWPHRILDDGGALRKFYFKSCVFRSLYHNQLHRWLRLFPRRQVMIIQSEMFFENPVDVMNDAAAFLGLEPFSCQATNQMQQVFDAGNVEALETPHDYAVMDDSTRRLLTDFFEPFNQQLYRLLDMDFGWN